MRRLIGVIALVSGVSLTAQTQPSGTGRGRIIGHVLTPYAELVGEATVTLTSSVAQTVRTTRTDERGSFSFENLPEGRYRVLASKSGYTGRQPPTLSDSGSFFFGQGTNVDLTENEAVSDLQVLLQRSASISGRVIRPDGSAAPGVQVQLAVRAGTGRGILTEAQATSQFDGRYEITGLPQGEYLVGALNVAMPTRRGFDAAGTTQAERNAAGRQAVAAATNSHWSWYPGVSDSEPGSPVTLLEGVNAEGIDIWLTPSQRFSVSGRVFWPVGVTLNGITIDYGDPGGTNSGLWLLSDPGGLFTLSGIAPGTLTMLVRAETDQGMMLGLATTEVTVDSVEDVRIVVDRPGLVAGRITYEGSVPAASRATGLRAVQQLLKVSALYPVPESSIDSSGRFELHETLGEYEFALIGLATDLSIKTVRRNGRPLPSNRIGVAAGETIRDVEIVVGR
jgi:hypothetical protein